jgi:hypothetical protein
MEHRCRQCSPFLPNLNDLGDNGSGLFHFLYCMEVLELSPSVMYVNFRLILSVDSMYKQTILPRLFDI